MKRFLLSSVAIAALLSAGQIANAQGTSSAPTTADRPAAEVPAEKKPVTPKAQKEVEQPSAAKPSTGSTTEQKAPSKAASETKQPENPSKSHQENKPTPKAESDTKAPATKSSTSTPQEKSAPAKASSETKETPTKSGATSAQPTPSKPANSSAETKPSAAPATPPAASNNASTPSSAGAAKTGDAKNGQPSSQNVATPAPNAAPVPPEKAAKINDVISREKVQSVENVNFSISVGVNVPSTVAVHALPESIVEIVPEYRGYDYVVVRDEIVIIQPRTRKIVTVIHRSGSSASNARSSTHISLTAERRRMIKQKLIKSSSSRSARAPARLVVGAEVPQTYEIREFPADVIEESPELKEYDYVVDEDEVVVVDRRDRRVIEVIE